MTPEKQEPLRVESDVSLKWVDVKHPQLAVWRDYAIPWIAQSDKNTRSRLMNLRVFLEYYLVGLNLPMEVTTFLEAGATWPNFSSYLVELKLVNKSRTNCHDQMADFLSWIIATYFSEIDAAGNNQPLPGFRNPLRRIQKVSSRSIVDISLRPHNDKTLGWVTRIFPEMAQWRALAAEWMDGEAGPAKPRLVALESLMREFIVEQDLPIVPEEFFRSDSAIPDFYDVCRFRRAELTSKIRTKHAHSFAKWVLDTKFSAVDSAGNWVVLPGYRNPIVLKGIKKKSKTYDRKLMWVVEARPDLEEWRGYAEQWLESETVGVGTRLKALCRFFDKYIIGQNLPSSPAFLLARKSLVPDFYETSCTVGKHPAAAQQPHTFVTNNRVSDFLDWVLITHFSHDDDDGCSVVSPAFRNPIPHRTHSGGWVNKESVHSPLPFGLIEDMRLMLAQGPTFGDWTWAHDALANDNDGALSRGGGDWYAVNERDIDKNGKRYPSTVFT